MRRFPFLVCLFLVLLLSLKAGIPVAARSDASGAGPRTTSERLRGKSWWPTSGKPAAEDYAGTEACARCHREIAASQPQSRMAQAASVPSQTRPLQPDRPIETSADGIMTRISTTADASTYTVSRGPETQSGQIAWAVGAGKMGITFLLQRGGSFYESQMTWFAALNGLDLTPGHTQSPLTDLKTAFGDPQSTQDAAQCLACHTTRSSQKGRFTPQAAIPGITCEACHGPGAAHVRAMDEGRIEEGRAALLNPIALQPVEQLDFCGACHRAPRDITDAKDFTPINIRFQPYRLSKSRCWSASASGPDPRLACTACHNPHQKLEEDPAAYDAKCLACHANRGAQPATAIHSSSDRKQAACPVAAADCVKCHMPRYNVAPMHGAFTDHDIRIVRPGEKFPL